NRKLSDAICPFSRSSRNTPTSRRAVSRITSSSLKQGTTIAKRGRVRAKSPAAGAGKSAAARAGQLRSAMVNGSYPPRFLSSATPWLPADVIRTLYPKSRPMASAQIRLREKNQGFYEPSERFMVGRSRSNLVERGAGCCYQAAFVQSDKNVPAGKGR